MAQQGILRYRQQREAYQQQSLQCAGQLDPPRQLEGAFAQLIADHRHRLLRACETGRPLLANSYGSAPEISEAMGLPWYQFYEAPFIVSDYDDEILAGTSAMGLGTDLNPVTRAGIHAVENGIAPLPMALIDFVFPGDDRFILHQVLRHNKQWRQLPMFCSDIPSGEDEQLAERYGRELQRLAEFLEQQAGRSLDWGRFRAVIEESNRQYLLWREYNELRRSVPCAGGFEQAGVKCFAVAQMLAVGRPEGTRWFQDLVDYTRNEQAGNDQAHHAPDSTAAQEVRLLWFDTLATDWAEPLCGWLQQQFGAVMVTDSLASNPCATIDTGSEETIWTGLARRGLVDNPLVRQSSQHADDFARDLTELVRGYAIDLVVWPGFLWQKEAQGAQGIIRETCREMGVPLLDLCMDLRDLQPTSLDEIKNKFSRYFAGAH